MARSLRAVASPLIAATLCAAAAASPQTAPASSDAARAAYLAAQEKIPLKERSDWINVQTDVEPAAVGDGEADDTAAIQAALDKMMEADRHPPVYLPPGTYRITDTLTVRDLNGGAIYGHGRATRLVWDGGEGSPTETKYGAEAITGARMFHSNGFGRCLYYGLTFDGRGEAAVGIDHDSKTKYETRVRHQYCAFKNFTDSGVRVGHDQELASAEMMFYDCLFENCRRGISTMAFNDYNNMVARNIFRNCGTGVYCYRGNVYVRDSHFRGSKKQDILLPPHSHSVRRCTSVGSAAFIRPSQPGDFALHLQVQDCLVRGWRSAEGAIQLGNAGPGLVFDSVFREPAAGGSAAIALRNPSQFAQTLMTANVRTDAHTPLVASGPEKNRVIRIPRDRERSLIASKAGRRWQRRPARPQRVFNAVEDFGADPTGKRDASEAIQNAVDAAAAHEGGLAEAYLPAGTYKIHEPIRLPAGHYRLAGPYFFGTTLRGTGRLEKEHEAMVRAHNPDRARIARLRLWPPKDSDMDGLHVTADKAGTFVVNGLAAGAPFPTPGFTGTHLDHLPEAFRVRAPHLDGSVHLDHCGRARVLLDAWFGGGHGGSPGMRVTGPTRSGVLGVHSAVGSHRDPDLAVRDSASIVFGYYYTEQTKRHLVAKGDPEQPRGRVTIANSKLAGQNPDLLRVEGYRGQVTIAGASMQYRPEAGGYGETVLPMQGDEDTALLLLGTSHAHAPAALEASGARALRVGGLVQRPGGSAGTRLLPDKGNEDWAHRVNRALDHLRELSRAALRQ